MSHSQPLPLKRQGEHLSDDGASAIKPSRLKIAIPSEDFDKKVTPFSASIINFFNPNSVSLFL